MKANRAECLVVGGDSLVGGALVRSLESRGITTISTTRRSQLIGDRKVHLDFENIHSFRIPQGIKFAYVVAAATGYEMCEKDPRAFRINVEFTPQLVEMFLRQNIFVIYVSTNTVFGGDRAWPQELDAPTPKIAYARQKVEAETRITQCAQKLLLNHLVSIVRLTKVLSLKTSPIPDWLATWEQGDIVYPFVDLIFAPMTIKFVGDALTTIGEKRIPSIYHLSGAANINYVEFAQQLSRAQGVIDNLVQATSAMKKGIHIEFKPTFSGLGMVNTTNLVGIHPQQIEAVIKDLLMENNAR